MGEIMESNPYSSNDRQLLGDGDGSNMPLSSHLFNDFDSTFDFGAMLSPQAMTGESLNNSLLNKGFDGACTSFDASNITNSAYQQSNNNEQGATTALVPDLNDHYQHNTVVYPPEQDTAFSPNPPQSTHLNTAPAKIGTQFSQSYTTRRPSLLRNEYYPETIIGAPASAMASHNHPQYFSSSPSRYVLRAPQGSLSSQGFEPFQESNMRSSTHQARGFNTIHQLGYNPNQQMTQQRPQTSYHDSRQYAQHPSGQTHYGLDTQHGLPESLAIAQPSTPPNMIASYVRRDHDSSSFGAVSPRSVSIKREVSASGSPSVNKEPRKRARRSVVNQIDLTEAEDVTTTRSDAQYVKELMEAMNDLSEAEDNPGMKATWIKLRDTKQGRVRETSVELLDMLKRAQHEQITDRKPVNQYPDFEHRFGEACAALRTQKTVCKHLMEPPYTHVFGNDPTYAAQVSLNPGQDFWLLLIRLQRVRNNRRVNGQKKQAIKMGRQALGLQGQGKGKSMKKIDPIGLNDLLDGNDSEDDPFADEDDDFGSPIPAPTTSTSSRKKSRRTRQPDPDDDYEDSAYPSPAPKKAKRENRSSYKPLETSQAVESPRQFNRSGGYLPSMSSSPTQRLEQLDFQRGNQQRSYYPNERAYGPTAPSLPPMLPEFYGSYHNHGSQSDQFAPNFSSSTDPQYSDQPTGGNNANASEVGLEHQGSNHHGHSH